MIRSLIAVVACLLILSGLSACQSETDAPELTFEGAWIRAIGPGMKMTAGFGNLNNPAAEPIELVTFASPYFGSVSLHRTQLVDGVSKMREVSELSIPAGESVELAPGGYHLMMMIPSGTMSPGEVVPVQITAADGRVFSFEVPVERR